MTRTRSVLALVFALAFAGAAGAQEIRSVDPDSLELEAGGRSADVLLVGSGVETLEGVRVLHRGQLSRALKASLLPPVRRGERVIRLEPDPSAPAGDYELQVTGRQLRAPLSVGMLLTVRETSRLGSPVGVNGGGSAGGDEPEPDPGADDGDIMPQAVNLGSGALAHGETREATVTVSRAPGGPLALALESEVPQVLVVPDSVTVQPGATSATFAVEAGAPTYAVEVTVTALRAPYSTGPTGTVTVLGSPAQVSTLEPADTCPPNSPGCTGMSYDDHLWFSGDTQSFRIDLVPSVGPEGGTVSLSTDRPDVASMPASLSVQQGEGEKHFTVTLGEVQDTIDVSLTASLNGGTDAYTMTVAPFSLVEYVQLPDVVSGGQEGTGTLVLWGHPNQSREIKLTSSDPSLADVPAMVEAPSGATSVDFPITTTPVSEETPVTIGTADGSRTATTRVVPPRPADFTLPTSVNAGESVTANLELDGLATGGGVAFAVTSSDPDVVQPPASVTVPANAYQTTFEVATSNHEDFEEAQRTVTVEVASPDAPGEPLASATLVVERSVGLFDGVTFPEGSEVEEGGSLEMEVALDGPAPPGGTTVLLETDDPILSVPPSATVPEGQSSAPFTVSASATDQQVTVALRARTTPDAPPHVRNIAVLPVFGVDAFVVEVDEEVVGGHPVPLRVELNRPPPAGASLTLASQHPAVEVPASLPLASAGTSIEITAATSPVDQPTPVPLTVTTGGETTELTLTLVPPPALTGLEFSPAEVLEGEAVTATLSWALPVHADLEAALSSERPERVQPPATVTIPAGETTVTFPVATAAQHGSGATAVTAQLGSGQVSADVVLTPIQVRPIALDASPAVAVAGGTITLTLEAKGYGEPGGTPIAVSVSHPDLLDMPAVTLPEGESQSVFQVTVLEVEATQAVTITATYADTSVETTVMVSPS